MTMRYDLIHNRTPRAILAHMLLAAVSLFVNGFGILPIIPVA